MTIQGFDPKWKDLPDFILGITKEIWEDRHIASLRHYYAEHVPVRSPAAVITGNEKVIAATMATLAEFPDRALLGEDVIWCGDEEDGFLSSHRLLCTATHLGEGIFGKATGKKLAYRVIADCAARNNQIYDEWLVPDRGAIARQLGVGPRAFAADLIQREGGPDGCVSPLTPETDVRGEYDGSGNDHPIGQRYADILTRIMDADMATIRTEYDRACQVELPGAVTGHGHGDADRFWMGLRAAFPSARFELHHVIGRDDPQCPPRAAVRWSLTGTHDGRGVFGSPSGAEIHVFGISHAEFGPWGLRHEYVLIDETAIWKQILLQTGRER